MKNKIIVIMLGFLLVGTTVPFSSTYNVKAATAQYNDEINGNYMFNITKDLSNIIKDHIHGTEYGIYTGRAFGSPGEIYTAQHFIYNWFLNNSGNFDPEIAFERIGNESYINPLNIMRTVNNKIDILGYGISLQEGNNGEPVIISNNESFPFPAWTGDVSENYEVAPLPTNVNNWIQNIGSIGEMGDNLNLTHYNISYSLLGNTETIFSGEITYITDYTNTTVEEKANKIHLIDVTDNNYNDTISMLEASNATGFILLRDNCSRIQNWSVTVPGIAVSRATWYLLRNLTENGTNFAIPLDTETISTNGYLDIWHRSNEQPICEPKIYLIRPSILEFARFTVYNIVVLNCRGFLLSDSDHPKTHYMYPTGESHIPSLSKYRLPIMSINGSIKVNGQMKDVTEWVNENSGTLHPIYANYWIHQRNNYSAISYNIYCDIPGKNQGKNFIFSGGHYDGWWGQIPIDDGTGVAIMMGVLKYLNDNAITPKYNTRFIIHGGEEYVDRGSISHVNNDSNKDFLSHTSYIINLDQLAHTFHNAAFRINSSDQNLIPALWKITEASGYNQTNADKGYNVKIGKKLSTTTDALPYYNKYNINHINFCKNNFTDYHQTGNNHTIGDVLNELDREDLNQTAEIIWNITKYMNLDPNCKFEAITYNTKDSIYDVNTDNDSIQINYTCHTTLPQDHVMVKAILRADAIDGQLLYPIIYRYTQSKNYTIGLSDIQDNINISLPKNAPKGFYTLKVYLFNSTGCINREVYEDEHPNLNDYDLGVFANETHIYRHIPLAPPNDLPNTPTIIAGPTGDLQVHTIYNFTASTTDPDNDPIIYQWNWRANKLIPSFNWSHPHPSGINDTEQHQWLTKGTYEVRVRARDIYCPTYTPWSAPYQINGLSPSTQIQSQSKILANQEENFHGITYGAIEPANMTWDLNGQGVGDGMTKVQYGCYVTYTYAATGIKHQTLTVRDAQGNEFTANHTTQVLNVLSNFTTNRTSAHTNSPIHFTNTSQAINGHSITNITWTFGDGQHAYITAPSHTYTTPGIYNVTLVVKHGTSDTDMSWHLVYIDTTPPVIRDVTYTPYFLVTGTNITFYSDIFENGSFINTATINITTPQNITGNYTMNYSDETTYPYFYTYTNTWTPGNYTFTIWATDNAGNHNHTASYTITIADSSPDDSATNIGINPTLSVGVQDPNEVWANVSFYRYLPNSNVIDSESDWKTGGTFTNSQTDGTGNLILANDTTPFGTGTNGDVTITSNTALTSDKNYHNLTINSGRTLNTQGHTVYVSGTLLNYGTITDSYSGGSGGSGGAGGAGQDFKQTQGGPKYAQAGSTGGAGSSGLIAGAGTGGHGGAGGGGGGGAWHNLSGNNAVGGSGGSGGTGGKGGGYVKILAYRFNNQGVIQANGSAGSNGANGAAGVHLAFTYLGNRDISSGGAGGGGGGNGGNGGNVNITYGVLLSSGKNYASGGAKGTKGTGGNGQTNSYGVNLGGQGTGQSGGTGSGAGGGGSGGNGRYTIGTSGSGANGVDGNAGSTGTVRLIQDLHYTINGSYVKTLNAGSVVEWANPTITASIPTNTSINVIYGENTTGSWRYYEDLTLMPACRWLKIQVNLSTQYLFATPSIDKIQLSTRTVLHTASEVTNGINATYVWSGRSYNTPYYWQVRLFNSIGSAYGPVWDFRTASS
jgi:hypothetical protein